MNTTSAVPITAEQRAAFDRDGYLIIRGALGPDEAAAAREALDRVYTSMAKAGSLAPDGSMHLLSAVANCPEVVGFDRPPGHVSLRVVDSRLEHSRPPLSPRRPPTDPGPHAVPV
jgi:hypothetical protein